LDCGCGFCTTGFARDAEPRAVCSLTAFTVLLINQLQGEPVISMSSSGTTVGTT
jgi:hypothetical protein